MNTLRKIVSLGAQHLLRDNWLCHRRVRELLSHEQLAAGDILAFQNGMLRRTLVSAVQRIPAYSSLNIPTATHELVPFLRETCPVVTKNDLIAARDKYYPNDGRAHPWSIVGKTSGTTGSPLDVFRSFDSVVWENAFIHRHWHWSGFKQGMRRATLRGDLVVDLDNKLPPYWIKNRADNQLLFSTRHLNNDNVDLFLDMLRHYQPFLLQAYPSAAFILAQALERTNQKLDIPWVFTASEMLHPYQRELIETRIGRVMDSYGMAERVAFASECEFGSLHVNTDYSFVEILDENNQPTDGDGFVVGTTFHNHLMPLIRYKLSDRTRWKPGACQCGRPYPMIEPIHGKFEDVLFGSTGSAISPSIITFAFKGLKYIEKSQVAQVSEGCWEVRVVPMPGFGAEERAALVNNIHTLIDPNLSIKVVECIDIPRTTSGKYRWVINEWKSGNSRSVMSKESYAK